MHYHKKNIRYYRDIISNVFYYKYLKKEKIPNNIRNINIYRGIFMIDLLYSLLSKILDIELIKEFGLVLIVPLVILTILTVVVKVYGAEK